MNNILTPNDQPMWNIIRHDCEVTDPTVDEMIETFGPHWRQARDICRTWATATPEQRQQLGAGVNTSITWNAQIARAARHIAWNAWAAWDVRFVEHLWNSWEANGAWGGWAARDAWIAAITQDNITAENYISLTCPWVSMFGPIV